MQEVPFQTFAAMGAVVASLITAAVSFVTLTLAKEQKTSEFRQAWIDGLRRELAEFFGAARAFARTIEAFNEHGPDFRQKTYFSLDDEKIGNIRHQAAETFCKIELRLNPNEAELLRQLQRALDEQNKMIKDRSGIEGTLAALKNAIEYAQPILKTEWNRVKAGEPAFRISRKVVAPAIVFVSLCFVSYICFGIERGVKQPDSTLRQHK